MNTTVMPLTNTTPPIITTACQVINVAPISANTYQIDLEAPEDITLNYIAGHYLQIALDVNNDGKPLSLSYSIASNIDPKRPRRLQLLIQHMSDFSGKVLDHLSSNQKNNESVSVTLPMGKSFLQTDLNSPHLLIAAGSGIAKIKCLAEAIVKQQPDADVKVFWSNRNIDDFYLLDELQDLVDQHKNLTFTPILEAPAANWSGRSGYIYKVIQEDIQNLDGVKLYLCGSPQMVYGTIDQLKPNGLTEENCYSDAFEHAPRQ